MAGPWEQFAAQPQQEKAKPWEQFQAPSQPSRSWTDVPLEAIKNIPSSAGNLVGGIYQAVRHPVDTLQNVADIGYGSIRNALPQGAVNLMDRVNSLAGPGNEAISQKSENTADAANKFFRERYGSGDALKNTLATDPVGAAFDASALLTGGAGALRLGGSAARAAALRGIPGAATGSAVLTGVGDALGTAGRLANPITPVAALASKALPAAGNLAASLVGGLGTHTGAETIKQAFRSGREGGESAQMFKDNLRGNVPITDVLDSAKANLQAIGQAKSDAYRQGMAGVSSDKSVLDFSGIDKAVDDAFKAATFKGQVKNTKAAQIQKEIADAVNEWKALPEAEYHTPEGLDALKQKIGGIADSIPYEEKTAGRVATGIYNAVKQEIIKQAPTYADTMKGYSDATEQIREIERALSLGRNASVDTAMRKLQSLTRNNVNTNYGNRLDLARQMEQQGGNQIMPALAGQALAPITPRGLGGAVAGGLGVGGYMAGGPVGAAATLAVQSPRLMGEAAYGLGSAVRGIDNVGTSVRSLLGRGASQSTAASPPEGLQLAPVGPYKGQIATPEFKAPPNIDLWSFADEIPTRNSGVPDSQRLATTHDYPTIDFPLRQEVLQQPEIASAIDKFRTQAAALQLKSDNAISSSVRAKAAKDLAKLQSDFSDGMRQLGINDAADAHGLNRPLYDVGVQPRLQIQRTFDPRNNK